MNSKSINQFWSDFTEKCVKVRSDMAKAAESRQLSDVNSIKPMFAVLHEFAASAATNLPLYDVKRSQQEIDMLKKQLEELESELMPRKKFAFSQRTMNYFIDKKSSSTPYEVQTKEIVPQTEKEVSSSSDTALQLEGSYFISNINGNDDTIQTTYKKTPDAVITAGSVAVGVANCQYKCFHLTPEELASSFTGENSVGVLLLIRNCHNVIITVCSLLGSVRIENCSNCVFLLSPCMTSCYLEGCVGCFIAISCHQLRIHNSSECNMFVKVLSHPIIEDCQGMMFSSYAEYLTYPTLSNDLMTAGLTNAASWANVVDFKWHKHTASPNWCVVPLKERISLCQKILNQIAKNNVKILGQWKLYRAAVAKVTTDLEATTAINTVKSSVTADDEDEI